MSTFLRASNSQAVLQAMALRAYGASGIVVPVWYQKDAWDYPGSGTTLNDTPVSGVAISGASNLSVSGFVAAISDGASGVYLCQHVGSLIHYSSGGSLTAYELPSGRVYVGAAYVAASGSPYVIDSSGLVSVLSGSTFIDVTPTFSSHPYQLTTSGNSLFTLLPALSGVGILNLTSLSAGTSSVSVSPIQVPMCLAVTSGVYPIALGGWRYNTFHTGFSALDIAIDPADQTILLGASSGSTIASLYIESSGNFSFNQSITGLSHPSFVTWNSSGTQAFICDPVSGHVYVASYLAGVLSLAQTLTLSGASQAAISPNQDWAFVSQPSQNQITLYYNSSGTWASSGTLALNSATALLTNGASGMLVGGSSGAVSGLFKATLSAGIWSLSSGISLGFIPYNFSIDNLNNIYAVGSVGSSGYLSEVSGSAVAATVNWSGSANGVLWEQGQTAVVDSVSALLRIFGPQYDFSSGALSLVQQNAYSQPSTVTGLNAIAFLTPYLVMAGNSSSSVWKFGAPYKIESSRSGILAVYNAGSWISTGLVAGDLPEAIAYDPSGNISVVTEQNYLMTFGPSGTLISSGAIAQGANQPQTTPIGLSKLLWLNNHLYGSTSLNDSLVEIV